MSSIRCRTVVLSLVVIALVKGLPQSGACQIAYQRLMELGTNSPTGYEPFAGLTEGPDGVLYGTTYEGRSVFRIKKDGSGFRGLASVTGLAGPYAEVLVGPEGALYGTTQYGVASGGEVFRLNRDGNGFRNLVAALPGGCDSALVQAANGALYGTSGALGPAVIFRVNPDGTGYSVVYQFGSVTNDGGHARASLVLGSDGALYGVTYQGGLPVVSGEASSGGIIFKINPDGTGYSVLHRFEGIATGDGSNPHARLIEASDGALYGTTANGGLGFGTIFRINKNGSGYAVVHRLDPSQDIASGPRYSHLVEGTNGALYGTTLSPIDGTVFKCNKDGSEFSVVYRFGTVSGDDGRQPRTGLLEVSDGRFYGTTTLGGIHDVGTVYSIDHDGSDYKVLASFLPPVARQIPRNSVLHGSDGKLYCTTEDVGSTNFGSLFRTENDGSDFKLLHQFGIVTGDGRVPNALLEASDGLLYGTTQSGGTNNGGTIFRTDKDGTNYTVLHRFTSANGISPRGGLIESSDGWLFGTANSGGTAGRGTVFRIRKDGADFGLAWSFASGTGSGGAPQGELVEGTNGVLYGTTRLFGSASRGTVYCVHATGSGHTILHNFTGGEDGQNPLAGLLLASDGALYGTTSGGNTSGGTVFALNHDGTGYRVLRVFGTNASEPRNLRGRLVEGPGGLLYGTTYQGGSNGFGTVFTLGKDGSGFHVVWHFGADPIDGRSPVAGLTVGPDGVLYGNTEAGGGQNLGTFFRLDARDVNLSIAAEGTNARVRWPATGTADALEESVSWSGDKPLWSAAGAMVSSNAGNYEASVPLAGTNRFLRVRREWK